MKPKLIKCWRIELYESSALSILQAPKPKSLFFTGYSKDLIDLNRMHKNDETYITLSIDPGDLATYSVRISRICEMKSMPVYEGDDCFLEAAKPMMKWLSDNQHPHTEVTVTSNSAELLESQRVAKTDEFLKD